MKRQHKLTLKAKTECQPETVAPTGNQVDFWRRTTLRPASRRTRPTSITSHRFSINGIQPWISMALLSRLQTRLPSHKHTKNHSRIMRSPPKDPTNAEELLLTTASFRGLRVVHHRKLEFGSTVTLSGCTNAFIPQAPNIHTHAHAHTHNSERSELLAAKQLTQSLPPTRPNN